MSLLKKVENLVAKNSIDEALNELERHITSNYYDLKKEIVLLKSRVSDIKTRRNTGTVDSKEEQITMNQIKHSILDIAKQLNEEQQASVVKQNLEIKVIDRYKRKSIIGEYLEFLRPHRLFWIWPLLLIGGIIYTVAIVGYYKSFNPFFLEKPTLDAKFDVLLDKNKFEEAEIFVDSVFQSNPKFDRETKKREIFSKKIDCFWTQNKLDSILLEFKNYRFRYVYPYEGTHTGSEAHEYNDETKWINNEIEKITLRFCKVHKIKAYTIIETYFRPRAVCTENTHCSSYYKDYSRKGELAEIVNNCH